MSNIGRITGVFNTPASGTTVITVDDAFAVHFWYSRVTADDTVQADQMFGHGFAAGGDRDAGMTAGEDGANQNQRDGRNDAWCLITDAPGTSDVVEGNAVTFNASNITLSYNTFSANHRIHYEIWYGTDGSAEMRQVAASTSPLSDLTMSTPDMVFCWTLGQGHPASSVHGYQSFGVAVDNAGIDQWVQYTYMGDSDTDSVGSALVDGQIAGQYNVDFTNWTMAITAIGSNGCTWSGSNGDQIIFLFLDLAGDNVHVGTFAKSTAGAPTTQQMPTFGFTPDGYGIASCNFDLQTINTNRIVVNSFGAYDEETGVGHSALSVGTASSNADRASWSSPTEVLAGSTALQANSIQWSGTPDAITDATPSIEWNPNTTGGSDDYIIGVYGHEQQAVAPLTCSGNPLINSPTASGVASQILMPSGTPTINVVTASGTVTQIQKPSGAATIAAIVASGVVVMGTLEANGAPLIDEVTASGTVIQIQKPSGTPSIDVITASGVAGIATITTTGDPTIEVVTASGTVTQIQKPSGTPSIDSPTASGTAAIAAITSTGTPLIDSPTAVGVVNLAPKVYLNTSQTLSGATQMTRTAFNLAGTSATFTDPVGAPVGALFLGVENRNLGGGDANTGWIAVTVGSVLTANGTPLIDSPTASGTATQIYKPSGTPSIESPTASGVVTQFLRADGTPLIEEITASGSVTQIQVCSGTPSIDVITASGVAGIATITSTGTPLIEVITASGVAFSYNANTFKLDTFTVGSDTPLENRTSDIGSDWQGNEVTLFDIEASTNSVLLDTASGVHTAIGDEDPSDANYFVETQGTLGANGGLNRQGVALRATGGASQDVDVTDLYLFRLRGNEGWQFSRIIGGALTELAFDNSWIGDNSIDGDDPVRMKATITGVGAVVAIKLEIDFDEEGSGFSGYVTVAEFTDTHADRIVAAGNAGLYMGTVAARKTFFKAEFVDDPPSAEGTPSIDSPTASGTITQIQVCSGTPFIDAITASGIAGIATITTTGTPSIEVITATGTVTQIQVCSGTPVIDEVTASGVAAVGDKVITGTPLIDEVTASGSITQIQVCSGTPTIEEITANGVVILEGEVSAFGTPLIDVITAVGTVTQIQKPSGTPSIDSPTASGTITQIQKPSGTPSIDEITASGVASVGDKVITGTPLIDIITASGVVTQFVDASGTPSIDVVTASGQVTQIQVCSGTPTIDEITASGSVNLGDAPAANGTPSIVSPTASGIATAAGPVSSASGTPSITSPTATGLVNLFGGTEGFPTIDVVTASGVVNLAPRVYLNTTQTLAGATQMTLTASNLAGTSATFTDPFGPPAGSLFLGVENRNLGGGDANTGWIAVTVNDTTGTGNPSIEVITASGIAELTPKAIGTPSIDTITASGVITQRQFVSGTPSIDSPTASGTARQIQLANGTPAIDVITASGVTEVGDKVITGTPAIDVITASGVTEIGDKVITGTPSIDTITATSTVTQIYKPSGTPSLDTITADGVAVNNPVFQDLGTQAVVPFENRTSVVDNVSRTSIVISERIGSIVIFENRKSTVPKYQQS